MHNLAQANISRFSAPLVDSMMKEFVDFLEPINKFARKNLGFVWRLKDEEGCSASFLESPFKDEMMAINISVRKDMESLKGFVYGSVHSYLLKTRKNGSTFLSPLSVLFSGFQLAKSQP